MSHQIFLSRLAVGSDPPVPQNIDLTTPLDAFACPATIHFYIQESDSAGGKRAEKEKDLFVIQSLPTVTNAEFTGSDPDKTALIEMPRLNAATNTNSSATPRFTLAESLTAGCVSRVRTR